MALHVEEDSETATEAWKSVPPLDSDDNTCDGKSSPCSSPPPMNQSVSFKPFAMSKAQKRAIAEKSSREISTATARISSESEDRQTGGIGQVGKRINEDAERHKKPGSTDLNSRIDASKQKALANNKPKKAERVAELYQRSLTDKRLMVLLETALRTNATPEQLHELQEYIDGTKLTPSVSRDTTPKDVTAATAMSEIETQTSNVSTEEMTTTMTQATEPVTLDTLAAFCATQLWERYCRLSPAPNTSVSFKAFTSSTINDRGQSMPKHPAPPLWLEKVVPELTFLLDVARVDRGAWIQTLMAEPGYGSQDVHALLAEEVRWAIHHAPYRKGEVRTKIVVLLECVGIERKGSFWYPG